MDREETHGDDDKESIGSSPHHKSTRASPSLFGGTFGGFLSSSQSNALSIFPTFHLPLSLRSRLPSGQSSSSIPRETQEDAVTPLPSTYNDFLERLKNTDCVAVVSSIKRLVDGFPVVTVDRVKAAAFIHKQTARITRRLLSTSSFRSVNDDSDEVFVLECVEKFLTSKLYAKIFAVQESDRQQDAIIRHNCLCSRPWIQTQHLEGAELAPDFANAVEKRCTAQLTKLSQYRCPKDKLTVLLNCCRIVMSILYQSSLRTSKKKQKGDHTPSSANSTHGSDHEVVGGLHIQNLPSADDFLPVLIWTLIRVNPPRVYSTMEFIQYYRSPDLLVSEELYYFTHFCSAVMFLRDLSASQLSLPEEEVHLYWSEVERSLRAASEMREDPSANSPIVEKTAQNETKDRLLTIDNHYIDFLEVLKLPPSISVVEDIKIYVDSVVTGEERLREEMERMLALVKAIAARLHSILANSAEVSTKEIPRAVIDEGLEKFVSSKLYSKIFSSNVEDKEADTKIDETLKALEVWLGNRKIVQNETLLPSDLRQLVEQKCAYQLSRLAKYKCPRDKVTVILNCCRIVHSILCQAAVRQQPAGRDASPSSLSEANQFLSYEPVEGKLIPCVLLWTLIAVKPPHLYCTFTMIVSYQSSGDKLSNEEDRNMVKTFCDVVHQLHCVTDSENDFMDLLRPLIMEVPHSIDGVGPTTCGYNEQESFEHKISSDALSSEDANDVNSFMRLDLLS